jgi:hypothetical protein
MVTAITAPKRLPNWSNLGERPRDSPRAFQIWSLPPLNLRYDFPYQYTFAGNNLNGNGSFQSGPIDGGFCPLKPG